MWVYRQITGALVDPSGNVLAHGYSGRDTGKNNPAMQYVKAVGPIPVGEYFIGPPYDSPNVGPYTLSLEAVIGTDTRGRGDFKIHGDSRRAPGTASHGCLIFGPKVRQAIWKSGDRRLKVVE